ncbi:MAG: AsmA family protein [Burkholderiales bacterium]|nr:AsmA family protein [Burkholderiales bacterium]
MFKSQPWRRIPRHVVRLIGWSVFVIFFVTFCLPLLFFYYLFNAQQVKQMVISQFNNENYSVVIDGNVEPRSWHGLSLFISDLTVEDKQKHKVLHVNTANCQLSWLDLIVGNYRVRRVALNGLTFFQNNLEKSNYSNLLNYQTLTHSEFKNLTNFSISNLAIINGDGDYLIKDAGLRVINLETLPEFNLNLNLSNYVAKLSIQGQVSKIADDNLKIENLTISLANPTSSLELQSSGHYAYKTQELWLESARGIIHIPDYQGALAIDTALLSGYGLTLNNLSTTLNGFESNNARSFTINADKINTTNFMNYTAGNIVTKYEFTTAKRSLDVGLNLNQVKFNPALDITTDSCKLEFKYRGLGEQTAVSSGTLNGQCGLNGAKSLMNFNLNGLINQSPIKLNLTYDYNYALPNINLDASVDNLDISKFMTSAQGNLLPLYSDTSSLPFDWISLTNLVANLKFKQLNLSHVNLSNVNAKLEVKNQRLNLSQVQGQVYDGNFAGSMVMDKVAESYDVSFKSKINSVNLQKVFASIFNVSAISGQADLQIDTAAKGVQSYEDLHKKINGSIDLNVNNGGFSGIDFSLFLSPENLAVFQTRSAVMTNFTNLKAKFDFTNGVSERSNLAFHSPLIMATGNGVINFANTSLDYSMIISSILPKNAQNVKSVSIPITVNGDLFAPKVSIQNMTLNTNKLPTRKNHNSERVK